MSDANQLRELLSLNAGPSAPSVMVFCESSAPRLEYACKFIFETALGVNFKITSDKFLFGSFTGPKISYSAAPAGGLHILPGKLLFSRDMPAGPCTTAPGNEDPFSFVFFFISRYEEWCDFSKDLHLRFEADQSILARTGRLSVPVVDEMIIVLRNRISDLYPSFSWPLKKFRALPTIDVDNLFAYRHKGLFRTVGAMMKAALSGKFPDVMRRISVLTGKQKDPFDVYDRVARIHGRLPQCWFFLMGNSTRFDRTVSDRKAFSPVLRTVKNHSAFTGIHPSYYSVSDTKVLSAEMQHFTDANGGKPEFSRQHYLRFDIRTTPKMLEANGITVDFTMGFATRPGFRAGTTLPFHYFDFEAGKAGNLLFMPFCAMDGAFFVYKDLSATEAEIELHAIANAVEKVNGIFTTVFHERTFDDRLYKGYGNLYERLLSYITSRVKV